MGLEGKGGNGKGWDGRGMDCPLFEILNTPLFAAGWWAVFAGGCVGLLPRYLENACIDPHQTWSVGKCSDHLQLIKFCPPRAAGRRSAAGRNFLAPPYYSQHAVFAFLLALFYTSFVFSPNSVTNYNDVNGTKFLRGHTVCLRRTPLLMCDSFVVVNLRIEF